MIYGHEYPKPVRAGAAVLPLRLFLLSLLACGASVAAAEVSDQGHRPIRPLAPITVTAARTSQPIADVPAHVTVITRLEIEKSAAATVDDLLRSVPGFSLFRRSSSLVAHPTSQGVSLRGVGPSGVSRTLVLLDGVPLNDPFGGWVYWSRVALESIDRIEVVRGGGSSVWGNYAMAGVINIVTRSPDDDSRSLLVEGGNHSTLRAEAMASGGSDRLRVAVDVAGFDSDGYATLAPADRGAIDERASSEHVSGGARLEYLLSSGLEAHLRVRYFREQRDNGTPLTGNATDSGFFRAGLDRRGRNGSRTSWDVFGQLQAFNSTFSRQEADRSAETLVLDQFDVPSASVGSSVLWSRELAARHFLTAGADYLWVDGETKERFRFIDGVPTRRRRAGGQQHLAGVYLQDLLTAAPRWEVAVGVRLDYWRSSHGRRSERDLESAELRSRESFGERDAVIVSPKLGVVYDVPGPASLRASYYQGFRAPTVNELYRRFQVRNDVTVANERLDPERLRGVDLGLDLRLRDLSAGVTGYWNRVDDAIANVTQAATTVCGFVPSGGLCRRRENLGHTRILGLELELAWQPVRSLRLSASYLLSDAETASAPQDRSLDGNATAQVPRHQAAVQADAQLPAGLRATLQLRYEGERFEDDRNALELDDNLVVDTSVSKSLGHGLELFVRAQNVFGGLAEVGRTGDDTVAVGGPTLLHAGLRYGFARPPATGQTEGRSPSKL